MHKLRTQSTLFTAFALVFLAKLAVLPACDDDGNGEDGLNSDEVADSETETVIDTGEPRGTAGETDSETETVIDTDADFLMSIEITPSRVESFIGCEVQLKAICQTEGGSSYDCTELCHWSSDDERYVTVSNDEGSKGLLTMLDAGRTVSIKAQYKGVSAQQVPVTVLHSALHDLKIEPAEPVVSVGETIQLEGWSYYLGWEEETEVYDWSSSDENVARVSNEDGKKGLLTGVAVGTATITMAYEGYCTSRQTVVTVE